MGPASFSGNNAAKYYEWGIDGQIPKLPPATSSGIPGPVLTGYCGRDDCVLKEDTGPLLLHAGQQRRGAGRQSAECTTSASAGLCMKVEPDFPFLAVFS